MNDPRSTPPFRRDPVFVGLFVAIMAWWTLHGLYGRSIVTDDGISLLAARGIREHGYPILPSGLVYARSYLAHYALALREVPALYAQGSTGRIHAIMGRLLCEAMVAWRAKSRSTKRSPVKAKTGERKRNCARTRAPGSIVRVPRK